MAAETLLHRNFNIAVTKKGKTPMIPGRHFSEQQSCYCGLVVPSVCGRIHIQQD
eukprot:gene19901-7021_t